MSGRSLSVREDVFFGVMRKRGKSESDDGMDLSRNVGFFVLSLIGSRLFENGSHQRLVLDQPCERLIIRLQPIVRKGQQRAGGRWRGQIRRLRGNGGSLGLDHQ